MPETAASSYSVLVVDDEIAMLEVLRERLSQWGYLVHVAHDASSAEQVLDDVDPELVISDVVLPDRSGVELLATLKENRPDRAVLLVTAHATVDLSVEAMKQGAEDFLTKPIDYGRLRNTLDALRADLDLKRAQKDVSDKVAEGTARFGQLIGSSPAMLKVYELISHVAETDAAVLITGESGTGKDLTARTIHDMSRRSGGPFVAVNVAAIPSELMESEVFGHEKGAYTGALQARAGCFELADHGTLFLDEIAEMALALQPKLLRVLEDHNVRRVGAGRERHVDVRVLAATNQEPEKAVREARLREDLFYRLNVFSIQLPPLRSRLDDIEVLAQHFLVQACEKHGAEIQGFRSGSIDLLRQHHWPGNVRELKNVIERAVILAGDRWIEPGHLPPYLRQSELPPGDTIELQVGTTVAEAERMLILKTLEQTGQNKAEAARRLGIDVKTVRNKLKQWRREH